MKNKRQGYPARGGASGPAREKVLSLQDKLNTAGKRTKEMASPNPIVSESMKKVLDRQRGANERDFGGLNVSLQGYDVPGALRQYRNEPYPTPVAEDLTRIFT